jgi:two-component system, NtrC family, sensor kinase
MMTADQELFLLRQKVADLENQLQACKRSDSQLKAHSTHLSVVQGKQSSPESIEPDPSALLIDEMTFRRLVEESNDVIWVTDLDGTIAYLSPAFETLFGALRQDWLGRSFIPLLHPDDLDKTQAIVAQVIQTGERHANYESRNLHQNGEILWADTSIAAIKNAAGQVIGLQGSLRDIRDRKRLEAEHQTVEEEFRQQDFLYRRIFETIDEGLLITDIDTGRILEANPSLCQMHGYTYKEMIGLQPEQYVAPNSLPKFAEFIEAMHRGERFHAEAMELHKDGTCFDIEVTGVPIWYKGRYCCLAILRDIRDRKIAEQQLEAQAQREHLLNRLTNQIRNTLDFNQILETTLQEIWQIVQADRCSFSWYYADPEDPYWETIKQTHAKGIPGSIGRYAAKHFPALMRQIVAQNVLEIADAAQEPDASLRQMMQLWQMQALLVIPMEIRSGMIGVITCEHLFEPRDWSEDEIELLQAVMEQFAIAINQSDLYTQARVQAYELEQTLRELKQTQTQMVQAEKMSSLGQLVAGVAHEINNPISFIHGNVNPALEYVEDLLGLIKLYQQHCPHSVPAIEAAIEEIDLDFVAEDLKKLLGSMKVGTERIREIVLSLRNFSRLDESEMKAVNIHEGIDSTLMILQNRLKWSGDCTTIQIIKNYGNLPKVECYAGQLNQVFMNLLVNAIDAFEESFEKSLFDSQHQPKITIQTKVNANVISIAIADNGPGISEALQSRLFDPFFTTKPVGKGTGMGLSISYQIITERHGGRLTCQSRSGQGTTFLIELPLNQ